MASRFSRSDDQWGSSRYSRADTGVSSDTRLMSSSSMGNFWGHRQCDRSSQQTGSNAIPVDASLRQTRNYDRAGSPIGVTVARSEGASAKSTTTAGAAPSESILSTWVPSSASRARPSTFIQASFPVEAMRPPLQSSVQQLQREDPRWFTTPVNLSIPQQPNTISPLGYPANPRAPSHDPNPPVPAAVQPRPGGPQSITASYSAIDGDTDPPRWRQPKFQGAEGSDALLSRDQMRRPILGGRSKKDQLGSVSESWGDDGEERFGLFTIEPDPPSPPNPFAVNDPQGSRGGGEVGYDDEVREARNEALRRARKGTGFEYE